MANIVIRTLEQLIDCLQLQVANLPTYQTAVGATNADMVAIPAALANLIYIRDFSELVDANKKAVTQIKQTVFNGEPTDTVSAFPVFPIGGFPETALAGELERAIVRNKRFRLGPGYTEEIGDALGLAGSPQTISPGSIIPVIEITPSGSDYMFSIVVSNRGSSDMWDVETRKNGSNTWIVSKTSSGKSTDVMMPPNNTEDPTPYQIQVRVRLRKGNDYYGQPSAISQTTVNP